MAGPEHGFTSRKGYVDGLCGCGWAARRPRGMPWPIGVGPLCGLGRPWSSVRHLRAARCHGLLSVHTRLEAPGGKWHTVEAPWTLAVSGHCRILRFVCIGATSMGLCLFCLPWQRGEGLPDQCRLWVVSSAPSLVAPCRRRGGHCASHELSGPALRSRTLWWPRGARHDAEPLGDRRCLSWPGRGSLHCSLCGQAPRRGRSAGLGQSGQKKRSRCSLPVTTVSVGPKSSLSAHA
jgi:hypothetical protein